MFLEYSVIQIYAIYFMQAVCNCGGRKFWAENQFCMSGVPNQGVPPKEFQGLGEGAGAVDHRLTDW